FFSSRRRHTRLVSDWSSDVCSSDLKTEGPRRRDQLPEIRRRENKTESLRPDGRRVVFQQKIVERGVGGMQGGCGVFLRHSDLARSEERRVGKEGRSRWWRWHENGKK